MVVNMFDENEDPRPPSISQFDSRLMFENEKQYAIANQILIYLNTSQYRDDKYTVESKDAARGAMIAATKYMVQHVFQTNKRQVTQENKEEILQLVADVIEAQLNDTIINQALPH